ncbi:hypothetical protein CC1G_04330 [Coprinopsis cinerea okayama7|uniref:Protein ZIP4 homolog n=1 Tax=Coprinopsis cinerea (strain Okayama-7 / 130 / ATCC MYA-4618 / FGSC 9003) TaxID=240176 RepID=A8N0M7_COPC7|nr:hypothetical protein CC1G_04330 [Coprinopsis cinerea okayama7\|eukprot:XP_001828359.2 hypothetical protein CC1G_04330 [Coprinopsis cinerea okayama7\
MQISMVRYAAFRLIEASLEPKPGVETLLHILQLACKTGLSLSEASNNAGAGSVLTSAARFEEMLRAMQSSEDTQQGPMASAVLMYLCSRMEVAWNEGNHTLAEFMSKKIADDSQRLALLTAPVKKYIALKFHNIGRSLLNDDSKHAPDAVGWLQRGFALLDKLPDDDSGSGISEVKVTIFLACDLCVGLRLVDAVSPDVDAADFGLVVLPTAQVNKLSNKPATARAYFITESYDRAEAVLDELIPVVEATGNKANPQYQELRWLRLTVLKRRKASESTLLDAFKAIVDHTGWSEANLTDILQELRALATHSTLVAQVHKHCIRRAVKQKEGEPDFTDRLALSIIFHCSKDDNHSRALRILDEVFTLLSETDVDFSRASVTACLTLLWQTGGRYYKAKKWTQAADWFLVGTHSFFKKNAPSCTAKCFRKAALCYIEQREYAKASTIIRHCPMDEAATQYIVFLTAFHQGLEDEAIRAIKDIQAAPDFDRRMLLLATQISHRSELKRVLLVVLEGLLKTLKLGSNGEIVVEAMALLRCIIKLILGLLVDPLANRGALIDTLVSHFRTAKILALSALEQKAVSLIQKDISWLWRTAYNCAVQGCSEWEGCGEQISELFDMARILLDTCWKSSPLDIDKESCVYLVNSIFAAVTGRVFSAREMISATGRIDDQHLRKIIEDIGESKTAIREVLSKHASDDDKGDRGEYILHVLRVFEMEFLIQLKDWERVSAVIKEVVKSGPMAVGTYEAFADLLWVAADCPVQVLQECLEAILNASLEHESLSVERFARWLRAICTIILSRNSPEDRTKAVGYIEHAVSVIQEYDSAKEISDTYTHLLARYRLE